LEIKRNQVTQRNIELRDGERLRSIGVEEMKFSKKIGRDEERASEGDNDRVMMAMTTKRLSE
jgi:hypothetical protein